MIFMYTAADTPVRMVGYEIKSFRETLEWDR